MKKFYCPVCGAMHTEAKDEPFKIKVDCPRCKTTLNVEYTLKALTVRFREPKEDWQEVEA